MFDNKQLHNIFKTLHQHVCLRKSCIFAGNLGSVEENFIYFYFFLIQTVVMKFDVTVAVIAFLLQDYTQRICICGC